MSNNINYGGKQFVEKIINGDLLKDFRPNHGRKFDEGYDKLYLYKFKIYLGTASHYILSQKLEDLEYEG